MVKMLGQNLIFVLSENVLEEVFVLGENAFEKDDLWKCFKEMQSLFIIKMLETMQGFFFF